MKRGFTLVEIMIVIVAVGVLATVAVMNAKRLFSDTEAVVSGDQSLSLNRASDQFLVARGKFDPGMTPAAALLVLQTPVDATSRKAGYGNFSPVDHRWTVEAVDSEFVGARLTYRYDAQLGRPVWGVAETGEGYRIKVADRAIPAPADWSARVASGGRGSATHSAWLWDYSDVAASNSAGPSTAGPVYGPSAGPKLTISGPLNITAPGTYYWTGRSDSPGHLTMTTNGANLREVESGNVVTSSTITVKPGDSGTVLVNLVRAEGGTASILVSYAAPFPPTVSLVGPDTVTTADPVSWTANVDSPAYPVTITVGTVGKQASGATSVTSDATSFPNGTNKTIVVTATAVNASGVVQAKKTVTVNVGGAAAVEWVLDPKAAGGTITERGAYTFTLRSVPAGGFPAESGAVVATASLLGSDTSGRTYGSASTTVTGTEATVTVVVDTNTVERFVGGTLRLDGSLTTASGTFPATMDIPIAVLRTQQRFSWRLGVSDGTPVGMRIAVQQIDGAFSLNLTAPGPVPPNPFDGSTLLGVGKYRITGSVEMPPDATNIPAAEELFLEVIP